MPILLVEDEASIAESVLTALELERLEAAYAPTLGEARTWLLEHQPEAVILDVGLPDGSGFDFCRQLRTQGLRVPVLFLTARHEVVDRVLGLELGGDDYLTKPFSPRELVARVRALLRRVEATSPLSTEETKPIQTTASSAESCGDEQRHALGGLLVDDAPRCQILASGVSLDLSPNEYRLLSWMMRSPGRIFSREQLLEAAWDDPWASGERTVDAHIKSIRAKLREALGEEREVIVTHRGFGYALGA